MYYTHDSDLFSRQGEAFLSESHDPYFFFRATSQISGYVVNFLASLTSTLSNRKAITSAPRKAPSRMRQIYNGWRNSKN
jgi:hypothetical protein